MRTFLFIYTLLMLAGCGLTLGLVPRALKEMGQERQLLQEAIPGARFDQMVDAGYRLNMILLLVEILYYYLLFRHAGPEWQFVYGGFALGMIHIFYLIVGRLEKWRLKSGKTRTGLARMFIWLTAIMTLAEICFLVWVAVLLLEPPLA